MGVRVMSRHTRGCGTRKTGGTYIFCEGIPMNCEQLPLPLPEACPCCGEEINFFRSVKVIRPDTLFKTCEHEEHKCHHFGCSCCKPPERGGLMWVGTEYTRESFVNEALAIGVSKRIPAIPKNLKIGDPLFLCHREALPEGVENRKGVFMVSHITAFHRILSEKDAEDQDIIDELERQGITPVVEVDDPDAYKQEIKKCQKKLWDEEERVN
jgi:hypothetical protein